MAMKLDPMELADELVEIARTTRDAQTGDLLMAIVERLLTEAGLPDADGGGEMPPSGWLTEPLCGGCY
jgi:hypothetical protein